MSESVRPDLIMWVCMRGGYGPLLVNVAGIARLERNCCRDKRSQQQIMQQVNSVQCAHDLC